MNCQCVPPKLAVLKVTQSGNNAGKEYFSCPTRECKFFTFVGQPMPMSLTGRNRQNNYNNKSNYSKNLSPQKVNGKFEVKLLVYEIIEGPPVEIWLSIQCPSTPVVNDLFSRLPQNKCRFNNGLKMWLFNLDQYERIIEEFSTPPFAAIRVPELTRFLYKGLTFYQKKINKLNLGLNPPLNLPPQILDKLLPFQLEGIRFVVRRGGRALLGDEMGCGKTLQAISVMVHYRQYWPVLIVVPSSLIKQWPDEIIKFAGDVVKASDIRVIGKSSAVGTGLITLITYKVMDNLVGNKLLTPDQFGVVIADESHNLKNKDSQRSLAVIPFLKQANIAVCMTGTPAVNRPVELYSQLNGILPEVFSDYSQFVHRYCDAKANKSMPGLNVSGSSNEQELNNILTSLVMIRRNKNEVLKSLPEKRRELRYVDPDPQYLPEIKRINARSKKLEDSLQNTAGMEPSDIQKMTNEKQQLLTALYTITGTSKIPSIQTELVKLIEESRAARGIAASVSAEELGRPVGLEATDSDSSDDDSEPVALEEEEVMADGGDPVHAATQAIEHCGEESTAARYNASTQRFHTDSAGMRENKKNASTSNKARIMELEDDFIVDLCGADEPDRAEPVHKRAKLGTADSDDESDCDFNLTDIKNGVNKGAKFKMPARIPSLFDQHSAASKIKAKTKAKAKLSKASEASKKRKKVSTAGAGESTEDDDDEDEDGSSGSEPVISGPVKSIGQKIIVFFHHKTVLGAIEDALLKLQVKFIKIDGATQQSRRAKLIDQFQNDNVTDVALLSITACGVGLNLTRANVALFGELNWSLGVMLQAEDRIHRLGQIAKEVRIIYMIARNTVDEIVWEQIQRKHQVVGATVGTSDQQNYGGGMRISTGKQSDLHSYLQQAQPVAPHPPQQAQIQPRQQQQSSTAVVVEVEKTKHPDNAYVPPYQKAPVSHASIGSSFSVPSSSSAASSSGSSGHSVYVNGNGNGNGYGYQPPPPPGANGSSSSSSSSGGGYGAVQPNGGASTTNGYPAVAPNQPSSTRSGLAPNVMNSSYQQQQQQQYPSNVSAAAAPMPVSSCSGYRSSLPSAGYSTHIAPSVQPTVQGPSMQSGAPARTDSRPATAATHATALASVLYNAQEDFSYSASTEASETTSAESKGSDPRLNRAGGTHPSFVAPPREPNAPALSTYNAAHASSYAHQQPSVVSPALQSAQTYPARTVAPIAAYHTAASAAAPTSATVKVESSKSTLPPEVLARIEANKLAAQARLAASRQKAAQVPMPADSLAPSSFLVPPAALHSPAAPPAVPQGGYGYSIKSSPSSLVTSSKSASSAPFVPTIGSPVALQAVIQSRHASTNVPPMAAAGASHSSSVPAAAHVFSTGRGSSIAVSDAKMKQAEALLSTAAMPGPVPGYVHTSSSAAAPVPHTSASNAPVSGGVHAHSVVNPRPPAPSTGTQSFVSATLYFDGTAQVNPAKGGAGYQLFASNGHTICEGRVRMAGPCTSNQAEYAGLIHGMTAALHCGVQELQVFGDSEVVIKQMIGTYQVKNTKLQSIYARAQALLGRFRRIQVQWIPREKNTGADALCQRALLHPESASESADWFTGNY